jgi:hypothetical protein
MRDTRDDDYESSKASSTSGKSNSNSNGSSSGGSTARGSKSSSVLKHRQSIQEAETIYNISRMSVSASGPTSSSASVKQLSSSRQVQGYKSGPGGSSAGATGSISGSNNAGAAIASDDYDSSKAASRLARASAKEREDERNAVKDLDRFMPTDFDDDVDF